MCPTFPPRRLWTGEAISLDKPNAADRAAIAQAVPAPSRLAELP